MHFFCRSHRVALWCVVVLSGTQRLALALNLLNSPTSKIVGISTGVQHLPVSYTRSFDRWKVVVVDGGGSEVLDGDTGGLSESSELRTKIEKQPQPSAADSDTLATLQFQPTLQVLVKGGVPTYVMPGLEFPTTLACWTAQQWATFQWAVEPNFRIFVYAGKADGTDDLLAKVEAQELRRALERLGSALQLPEAQTMSTGFHMVSLSFASSLQPWISLPSLERNKDHEILTCLATAEQDPREVLTLDPALAEMTISTLLQIPLRAPT